VWVLAAGDPELDAGRGQGVARGTVLTGVVSQVTLALQPIHVEAVSAVRCETRGDADLADRVVVFAGDHELVR
jgi:hypothetical protein